MTFNYYKAPSDEIFNDIKAKAIELWKTYDDTHGYASEKVKRIENIQNVEDNAWYIMAMFDHNNTDTLIKMLSPEAKKAVDEMLQWSYSQ